MNQNYTRRSFSYLYSLYLIKDGYRNTCGIKLSYLLLILDVLIFYISKWIASFQLHFNFRNCFLTFSFKTLPTPMLLSFLNHFHPLKTLSTIIIVSYRIPFNLYLKLTHTVAPSSTLWHRCFILQQQCSKYIIPNLTR